MKHQQVIVDYWNMIKVSFTCLLLAFSGYIIIKMVQTIFWLPGYLQKNQKRLEELAAQYSLELNEDKGIANDFKGEIEQNQQIKELIIEKDKTANADITSKMQEPKKQK